MSTLPGDVDVVIWGAGIAGSRAAGVLVAAGRSVLVFPRGPGSYLALPGFAIEGESANTRQTVEARLLGEAEQRGATIARGVRLRSLQPAAGPVRAILTKTANISTRVVIFADGSDPRLVRPRGLRADWEPWHLVHFAYQTLEPQPDHSEVQVIAGLRDGREWRGYSVPLQGSHMFAAGWFLEHEMATNVHASELLPELRSRLQLTGVETGEAAVEVTPLGTKEVQARLSGDNTLVIGDMAGLLNPFSLHRVEQSLGMGEIAARLVNDRLLQGDGAIQFGSETGKILRSSVQTVWNAEAGLAMPVIPEPVHPRRGSLSAAVRRLIKH
jgi:flavin-dependent dehydrogenase